MERQQPGFRTVCKEMRMFRTMLVVAALLVACFSPVNTQGQEEILHYEIQEESDVESFLGNVARDSKLYSRFSPEEFQKLSYSISTEGTKFKIDDNTSTIRTKEVLDREQECEFNLPSEPCELEFDVGVYKWDRTTKLYDLLMIVHVTVVLEDINDNAPEFPSETVYLSVPESVPVGHVLLTSGAVDSDTGPNNNIQEYRLVPENGAFRLQVMSSVDGMSSDLGIVIHEPLDRELQSSYYMQVIAVDGGYPQRSGSVNITINVEDVNDNAPSFNKDIFNITVDEDAAINVPILRLVATDPDSAHNGALTFSFSSRTSQKIRQQFAVDPSTGAIILTKPLDFEKDKRLQFMVVVQDHGSPKQQAQAAVIVNVADVNDNAPKIGISLPPGGTNLAESIEVGSFIAHVSLSDLDEGKNGEIECSLTNRHFKLEKFSDFSYIFKILLQKSLDFETARQQHVNVSCHDLGTPPLYNSSSFTIHVRDENDNAPLFTKPVYDISVRENMDPGLSVFRVIAMDPDTDDNGNVTYSLVENPESAFSLDSITGILRAMKRFDRESRSSYRLVVRAKDRGIHAMSSTAQVLVEIDDVNDSPTHFAQSHFEFFVEEEQPKGSVVDSLRVVDQDDMASGQLQFSFLPDIAVPSEFNIDVYTGQITTTRPLDRESGVSMFDFKVFLVDTENMFNDSASVRVTVTDINDHAPNITFPVKTNRTVKLPYTVPAGTIVTRVKAHDQDKGENGSSGMTYNLDSGDTKDMFLMNGVNGQLILTRRLYSEDVGIYHLRVSVQDSGHVIQMTTVASLDVVISRSNASGLFSSGGKSDHNVAIVVTLVCVTVALALAVLATICIIRRIDRERKRHNNTKMEEQNIYKQETLPPASMEEKTPAMENYENEMEKLKRKIKREMSFVSDDMLESTESIHMNNGSAASASFSTFKKSSPLSTPKMMSTAQASGSPEGGGSNSGIKRVHYVDKSRDLLPHGRPSSPGVSPTGPSWTHQHARSLASGLTVRTEGEDASSHTSGSTSDSGRGGSSEDDNSHAGVGLGTDAGEDLRLHGSRGYLGNPSLSTFRSPNSSRPERSLLSSLQHHHQQTASNSSPSGSAHNIYTNLPSKAYQQAPVNSNTTNNNNTHTRTISFSDDSPPADRRNRSLQASALSSPQQEQHHHHDQQQQPSQQRRQSVGKEDTPAVPRGILTNKDNYYRSYRHPPSSSSASSSLLSKSLPYRRQLSQQRHSPPLPPPAEGSGEDIYGVRNKVVNFSVGDVYEMTPRRAGSSSRLEDPVSSSPSSSLSAGDSLRRSGPATGRPWQNTLGHKYSCPETDSGSVLGDGQSATGTTVDDEDQTTTTSGSYTLNADDLSRDIDSNFFNDVVV